MPAFSLYAASGGVGQIVTLRTLMLSGGQPVLGKSVQFQVDGVFAGQSVTDATGASIAYKIPAIALGLHNVTVSFAGDAEYAAASRTAAVLTVKPNTLVSFYGASGVLGKPVLLRSILFSGSTRLVGKRIVFTVEGIAAGAAFTDANGVASLTWTVPLSLGTGAHDVTAAFAGDASYAGTSRTAAVLTVSAIPTAFSFYGATGSPGQTVNLRCILMAGSVYVSGVTVNFSVDGIPVGSAVTDAVGTASLPYRLPLTLAFAKHNVTAAFAGLAPFADATRTAAVLTVTSTNLSLLVSGGESDAVFRYTRPTGAFFDVFASGNTLDAPGGIAVGPDGNVYVTSFWTHRILRFNGLTGAFMDVFAGGGVLDGPEGIMFRPDGKLYVVSRWNHQILRYNATTGAFIDVFATGGLNEPFDMAIGPDGNLYVSSRNTNTVVRYNGTTGAYMGVFASGNGLSYTVGIAFGPDGNLYVASMNSHQVLRFNGLTGAYMDVFAAGPNVVSPTYLLFGPDSRLYVSCGGANQVRRYNAVTGAFQDIFVPTGSGGISNATFMAFGPAP